MHTELSTITARRSMKPATALFTLAVAVLIAIGAIALAEMERAERVHMELGPAEAGSIVELEAGDVLAITLPANPATGYGWVVSSINPAVLAQVGEAGFSARSDLIGTGGTITLSFEGTAIGQSDLRIDYLRSWEEAEPLDTYLVTVNVR